MHRLPSRLRAPQSLCRICRDPISRSLVADTQGHPLLETARLLALQAHGVRVVV